MQATRRPLFRLLAQNCSGHIARHSCRAAAHARTCRPHVDAKGVFRRPQQDLRGAVPPRGHIVCQDWGRPLVRLQLCDTPSQAKVRQLHRALAVQQQIARLRAGNAPGQTQWQQFADVRTPGRAGIRKELGIFQCFGDALPAGYGVQELDASAAGVASVYRRSQLVCCHDASCISNTR